MTNVQLKNIALEDIVSDPEQPRNISPSLDELISQVENGDLQAQTTLNKLTELATSILEVGLQQPISVYPAENDEQFIILDGHRRWLAMKLLQRQGHGASTVRCYVHPAPEAEEFTLLSQLNVNIQREDLNVFELARSSKKLKDYLQKHGGTIRLVGEDGGIETTTLEIGAPEDEVWEVVEKKMGIGRSRRYQIQAVLKLPPEIQQIAENGGLSESRLRYLIPLEDERIQNIIIREMLEKNLSNAEIKHRIKELQEELSDISAVAMPKPMRIKSAIKPITRLAKEIKAVHNVPGAIVSKDPRTVESYREVIPELKAAVEALNEVLAKLGFLDSE